MKYMRNCLLPLVLLATLSGCGNGDPGRPTATTSHEMTDMATAEIVGTLQAETPVSDGPVHFTLDEGDGFVTGLVFPSGWSATQDGEGVLDASGDLVASVGSAYSVTGGEYALGEDVWSEGSAVDQLWLVGEIDDAAG